ncbi:hypothetical protein HQ587_11350 [bacterium]|nr:hypothetical protein [bacterium]
MKAMRSENLYQASSALIIPTRGGADGVTAKTLLSRWRGQKWLPDELIIVRGASNSATGRNLGVNVSDADLLIFLDDDGEPCDEMVLKNVVMALIEDESIWLSGAAIQLPESASRFQRMYARQLPQNVVEIKEKTVDSVYAFTLCCAIERTHFNQVGGFNERLIATVDSELRDRLRRAGGRVVVAAGAGVYHPPPKSLSSMMCRAFWYGKGVAQGAVLFKEDNWRTETKPRSMFYMITKTIFSVLCLILDWDELREHRIKPAFMPLRMLHIWSMSAGYIYARLFMSANDRDNDSEPIVEKYSFDD